MPVLRDTNGFLRDRLTATAMVRNVIIIQSFGSMARMGSCDHLAAESEITTKTTL